MLLESVMHKFFILFYVGQHVVTLRQTILSSIMKVCMFLGFVSCGMPASVNKNCNFMVIDAQRLTLIYAVCPILGLLIHKSRSTLGLVHQVQKLDGFDR